MFLSQDTSNNDAPQKEEEEEVRDAGPDEGNKGTQGQNEESLDDIQVPGEEQHEARIDEEEMHQEQQEHHLPQVPEAEVEQEVPVHQGQPEIWPHWCVLNVTLNLKCGLKHDPCSTSTTMQLFTSVKFCQILELELRRPTFKMQYDSYQ